MNRYFLFIKKIFIFIKIKKTWKKPKKAEVLIYDHPFAETIKKYFNSDEVEVYYNRFEEDSKINFYIVLKCFLNLNFQLKKNYKDKYFKFVNPKVVITFNDNNPVFFQLKKQFPNIIFVAIQKAWKYDTEFDIIYKRHSLKKNSGYYCDYLFCYNKHVAEIYSQFISYKKVFAIGSFTSNSKKIEKNAEEPIVFISQWRSFKESTPFTGNLKFGDWQKNEIFFLKKLSEYLKKKSLKIKIIGKTTHSIEREKNFYEKIFNDSCTFIPQSYKRNHYKILDNSRLVISLESTLAYESLARGNRTIFFSIRSDGLKKFDMIRFCWPETKADKGPNWSNEYNFEEFERLFSIMKIKDIEWSKIINSHFNTTTIYDEDNSQFTKLMLDLKIPLKQEIKKNEN